jgi:probable metal-binding protein
MGTSVHGHKVMDLLLASETALNKSEFLREVILAYGEETSFHTCSAKGLSAEGLIDLLINKGKFIESENGLTMAENSRCDH